ncbi:MAG: lamin tail domain-containing protein, partial [Promethearchaeota archaeon]
MRRLKSKKFFKGKRRNHINSNRSIRANSRSMKRENVQGLLLLSLFFLSGLMAITIFSSNTSISRGDLNKDSANIPQTNIKKNSTIKIRAPNSAVEATNVCFTEIYADGTGDEWVEIYNPTSSPVDLGAGTGWKILDGSGSTEATLSGTLNPGEVIRVGDSGAIPTPDIIKAIILNDGGDDLILVDENNVTQDVVVYGTGTGINIPLNQWYWLSSDTAPAPSDPNQTIVRINRTLGGELEDNNLPSDWEYNTTTSPGTLPQYGLRPNSGMLLISEVMYGGTDGEWIELVNNKNDVLNLGGVKLYSYVDNNETTIPIDTPLMPYETYVIAEPSAGITANQIANLSLNDAGDVLVLKNSSGSIIDTVVWGSGVGSFIASSNNGWTGTNNATGSLNEGQSIFRYNLTRTQLSDVNSSKDWYVTDDPTPNGFYEIKEEDILFSEIAMAENSSTSEYIELYNNLSWPVTLDQIEIWDYGGNSREIQFLGNITIPARGVIIAGDSPSFDYYDPITLTNTHEDLVMYRDPGKQYELDVVIYGNDASNTYPRGPNSGWNDTNNVTGTFTVGNSIQRINGSSR